MNAEIEIQQNQNQNQNPLNRILNDPVPVLAPWARKTDDQFQEMLKDLKKAAKKRKATEIDVSVADLIEKARVNRDRLVDIKKTIQSKSESIKTLTAKLKLLDKYGADKIDQLKALTEPDDLEKKLAAFKGIHLKSSTECCIHHSMGDTRNSVLSSSEVVLLATVLSSFHTDGAGDRQFRRTHKFTGQILMRVVDTNSPRVVTASAVEASKDTAEFNGTVYDFRYSTENVELGGHVGLASVFKIKEARYTALVPANSTGTRCYRQIDQRLAWSIPATIRSKTAAKLDLSPRRSIVTFNYMDMQVCAFPVVGDTWVVLPVAAKTGPEFASWISTVLFATAKDTTQNFVFFNYGSGAVQDPLVATDDNGQLVEKLERDMDWKKEGLDLYNTEEVAYVDFKTKPTSVSQVDVYLPEAVAAGVTVFFEVNYAALYATLRRDGSYLPETILDQISTFEFVRNLPLYSIALGKNDDQGYEDTLKAVKYLGPELGDLAKIYKLTRKIILEIVYVKRSTKNSLSNLKPMIDKLERLAILIAGIPDQEGEILKLTRIIKSLPLKTEKRTALFLNKITSAGVWQSIQKLLAYYAMEPGVEFSDVIDALKEFASLKQDVFTELPKDDRIETSFKRLEDQVKKIKKAEGELREKKAINDRRSAREKIKEGILSEAAFIQDRISDISVVLASETKRLEKARKMDVTNANVENLKEVEKNIDLVRDKLDADALLLGDLNQSLKELENLPWSATNEDMYNYIDANKQILKSAGFTGITALMAKFKESSERVAPEALDKANIISLITSAFSRAYGEDIDLVAKPRGRAGGMDVEGEQQEPEQEPIMEKRSKQNANSKRIIDMIARNRNEAKKKDERVQMNFGSNKRFRDLEGGLNLQQPKPRGRVGNLFDI